MASKEEMIAKIYEKIARKDLDFGCNFIVGGAKVRFSEKDHGKIEERKGVLQYDSDQHGYMNVRIIGHPVMIGDVLEYCESNKTWNSRKLKESILFGLWSKLREPIDNQSNECIESIYDLCTL